MNQNIVEFVRSSQTGTVTLSLDLICANSSTFPFLSGLAPRYDKVKWHKFNIRWLPAMPTNVGSTVTMYYDTDRKAPGATTISDAMQNVHAITKQVWDKFTYKCTNKQLRTNEMFTTTSGTDAATANAENTFQSPGRFHVVSTPLTGVTFSTATTIGYLELDYHAELCFPSNPQTGVPTRRGKDVLAERQIAVYNKNLVEAYHNFAAGCVHPPNFYQFLACFDQTGNLDARLLKECEPDSTSFELFRFLGCEAACSLEQRFTGRTMHLNKVNLYEPNDSDSDVDEDIVEFHRQEKRLGAHIDELVKKFQNGADVTGHGSSFKGQDEVDLK